jgi:hypothetical protein
MGNLTTASILLSLCSLVILKLSLDEIFGKIEDERENEGTVKKIVEMKKNKAYESFYMLSKVCNFEKSIFKFLDFVKDQMSQDNFTL